jgi:HK97 family phage portal protein
MGLSKRARRRAAQKQPDNGQLQTIPGSIEEWALGGMSSAGPVVTAETAQRVVAVLSCWRVLANAMSLMPLVLYRRVSRNGKERAKDHPLYDVLHDRPNNWQHTVGWVKQGMMHLCGRGNSYSLMVPGRLGAVDQLVPLHPDRVNVEMLPGYRLRYIYREDAGKEKAFSQDEILHIRWLSTDGVTGLNPIRQAREAIGLAAATEQHGATVFGNGASPGFALSSDQPIKPETSDKVLSQWNARHQGPRNAHKAAILPFGLKPVPLGMTAEDSQFIETRKYQRSEIAALYGIPPHLIGDLDRATFSNIEQQSLDFIQQTILPWCREWEAAINRTLLDEDERKEYFAEFNVEGMLRADSTTRAAFYTSLWNLGVLSANEIREKENMNPLDEEGADLHFIQLNMQTLENAARAPEPAPPTPPEPIEDDPVDDPEPEETEDEDDPQPEPQEEGMSALGAARQVLRDEVGKLLRWEADAMIRLAAKPKEFLSEVESFYIEHFDRSTGRLATISYLLNKLGESHDLRAKTREALDTRMAEIVEASGRATNAEQLKQEVEAVTAAWMQATQPEGAR